MATTKLSGIVKISFVERADGLFEAASIRNIHENYSDYSINFYEAFEFAFEWLES